MKGSIEERVINFALLNSDHAEAGPDHAFIPPKDLALYLSHID